MSMPLVKPARPSALPLVFPDSAKVGEVEIKIYRVGPEFKVQMATRGPRMLLIHGVKSLLEALERQPEGHVVVVE